MMDQTKLVWGLVLAVGFPLLSVLLGEVSESLQRRSSPLASFLRNLRLWVLPSLAVLQVMRAILDIPESDPLLRILRTIVWCAGLYTLVSFLNVLFTPGNKQRTWQIHIPNLLFQFARAAVILGFFTFILGSIWQVDLNQLATAMGVGSLVIALALQDTLSNLVSGFLLIFESPFKVGDWIRVGEMEGEVIEINWRAVRLKTLDRDIVIIPNGNLGKETICNYTLIDPTHAVRIKLKFSYFDAPNRIKQILEEVALSVPGILSTPPPDVTPNTYGNSFIEYEARFFIREFGKLEEIQEEFLSRVYYAAKRHQLHLPFADKVEYKLKDFPVEVGNSPDEMTEFLRSLPYFTTLHRDLVDGLVHHATLMYYGAGEQIVQAGQMDQGFHIILNGEVLLSVKDKANHSQPIARLSNSDFFGEMVLLPGEPNPATVTVIEDLKAILLPPETVVQLVQRHPKFALEINQFIEERRRAIHLATQLEGSTAQRGSPNGSAIAVGKKSV